MSNGSDINSSSDVLYGSGEQNWKAGPVGKVLM